MAGGAERADVIFASLPRYLDVLALTISRCGYRVYYLGLSESGQSAGAKRGRRAQALRLAGVCPLPLESLSRIEGFVKGLADPGNLLDAKVRQLAPSRLLDAIGRLYPDNTDVARKLHVALRSALSDGVVAVSRVNCWAQAHSGRRHVLIYPDVNGMLAFGLAANVRPFILPLGVLIKGVATTAGTLRRIWNSIIRATSNRSSSSVPSIAEPTVPPDASQPRAAFVVHDGLGYGNLYQKTLYYSDRTDSELHSTNLLHFDYSGISGSFESLKWVCIGTGRDALMAGRRYLFLAMRRGIFHIRNAHQMIGLLLLARIFAMFKTYSERMEPYPALKVALIDYEILCPMALLLAFDARSIKTLAAQERFIGSFYKANGGAILQTYLCGSEYASGLLQTSPAYRIDQCRAVGQHRSDQLVAARNASPPRILQSPIAQGRKIITALGFHTHKNWYESECDPLLNWAAHRHFLEEIIQLSIDLPNVFIVLRYKDVEWLSLPVFADVVRSIEASENLTISLEYDKSFFSYDLCAHSDLVIAKHTSLGDECLAVGIPVLFHDYTQNVTRIVADAFDYRPARVMCFSYKE